MFQRGKRVWERFGEGAGAEDRAFARTVQRGDGARLQQDRVTCGIDGPFDIEWPAEDRLGADRHANDSAAQLLREFVAVRGEDTADASAAREGRGPARVDPADHCGGPALDRGEHHAIPPPADRVRGEKHSAPSGPEERLHQHRHIRRAVRYERARHVLGSAGQRERAVEPGTGGGGHRVQGRRPHLRDRAAEVLPAAHAEHGGEQSGHGMLGAILGDRGRAHHERSESVPGQAQPFGFGRFAEIGPGRGEYEAVEDRDAVCGGPGEGGRFRAGEGGIVGPRITQGDDSGLLSGGERH
nr:hypothetical protein [Nocardia crassostreae]